MIALDTNILARYYVNDPGDAGAAAQTKAAYRLLCGAAPLFVPMTVVLELEWVLRAFYEFTREDFARVVRHLLGLPNVRVENWPHISDALDGHLQGMDFADALHLAASHDCTQLASFDTRFAKRASRLNLSPPVVAPKLR